MGVVVDIHLTEDNSRIVAVRVIDETAVHIHAIGAEGPGGLLVGNCGTFYLLPVLGIIGLVVVGALMRYLRCEHVEIMIHAIQLHSAVTSAEALVVQGCNGAVGGEAHHAGMRGFGLAFGLIGIYHIADNGYAAGGSTDL